MLSRVYDALPLKVERAHGVRISTDKGEFIDTFAGIGVLAFGHTDEKTIEAIKEKIGRFSHTSNYFLDEDAISLGQILLRMSGGEGEVFFTNSGTEATEAAIKAIRKLRRGKLVSFEGNFHGRTMGALSLTHSPKLRTPFEPLLPDTVFLPLSGKTFEDFAGSNEIAGVFVEPVQGNSGVYPLPEELIEAISSMKEKYGFLIVADEIQSGLCRTGDFFAYQHHDLRVDIITVGKAVGGGLPLGAAIFCGVRPFAIGDHGSTFAPNPVSLAAGKSVVERMDTTLLEGVKIKGEHLRLGIEKLAWVKEIRGRGLMLGLSTHDPVRIKEKAFDRGVLLNVTGGSIRLLPALNISIDEIDEILERLDFGG